MSEIVVEAIVAAPALQQFVKTYTPFVSEGRLNFDSEGLHAKIVDPANVGMAFADLSTDAFESYESGTVTVGVSLDRLAEALKIAGAGDLVHLTVDMEARRLGLQVDNIDQDIGLIDPQAIRDEPDLPDLDLPNSVTVEGGDLDTVETVAKMVGDHLSVEGDSDAEEVRFVANGDTEESTVTFGHDEVIDAKLTDDVASLFSLDYVSAFVKPVPADAEVTIAFGDEFPMTWEWVAAEGHLEVMHMLAPRIQSR